VCSQAVAVVRVCLHSFVGARIPRS